MEDLGLCFIIIVSSAIVASFSGIDYGQIVAGAALYIACQGKSKEWRNKP